MIAHDALDPRLAAPPRRLPLSLQIWLLFGGPGVLAWIWFGFGAALSIVLIRKADLSWLNPPAATAHARGFVEGCDETGSTEGGSDTRRGTPIYANRFRFQDATGTLLHGLSYATGQCLDVDAVVDVEYDVDRPAASQIVGMRRAAFGQGALFVLVFPLVGVVFIAAIVHGARQSLRLLEHGELARGRLVKDTGYAWLLYHPTRPDRGLVRDVIPPGVTIGPDGQLRFDRPFATAVVLLFPIATVVAVAVTLTMKL